MAAARSAAASAARGPHAGMLTFLPFPTAYPVVVATRTGPPGAVIRRKSVDGSGM